MRRSAFIGVALAIHLTVFWALRSAAMQAPKVMRKPIEISIVEPPKPPPSPPPDVPKPKPKVVQHVDTPPPPKPSNEPPPPPVFGLSLSSTAADSTFTMQQGNTTMTEQQKGPPPKDVRPLSGNGKGGRAVSLTQLTKMPEKIGECPPGNPSALYTAEARDRGIEGDVVVETELDAEGHVAKTRVLRKLGYGLDENAANAIRERCKFKPAEVNGEKVGTTVTLTFHFIIEE